MLPLLLDEGNIAYAATLQKTNLDSRRVARLADRAWGVRHLLVLHDAREVASPMAGFIHPGAATRYVNERDVTHMRLPDPAFVS